MDIRWPEGHAPGIVASMADYVTINRANWDERAPIHAASDDYGFARFQADPHHLSDVVTFDRPRLGDLTGIRGVHLQCHIGTDTLSLTRLGARMSGLDFSPAALTEARRLAESTGTEIDYRESEVYKAVDVFGSGQFDLVYTGIGALCWLPSVAQWAKVVAALLKPGGRLFIREGHPMLWTLDEQTLQPSEKYTYFEEEEPYVDNINGTYVQTDSVITKTLTHSWNHSLGETVTALLAAGMRITGLDEHNSVPWNAFPRHMTMDKHGEHRLTKNPQSLAASYTLQAIKE